MVVHGGEVMGRVLFGGNVMVWSVWVVECGWWRVIGDGVEWWWGVYR